MHLSATQRTGRLAPSPTGALHLGNIRTFMVAWLQMRSVGGSVRMRIEDLDHPKHKVGAEERMLDDLQWLGFDWDGPVEIQSKRTALYQEALTALAPHLYPCTCSRTDIQNAQSAPHPGEVLRYPGTCRTLPKDRPTPEGRPPAWRYALAPSETGTFTDAFAGPQPRGAAELSGDFVVARGEEAAYTLAVVVDDAAMQVTDVVRGDDILPATPAQNILYDALGLQRPAFFHVPLMVGRDGRRLAKRHGDTRIASYRAAGITAGQILTALARTCGWLAPNETVATLPDLLPHFSPDTIPHEACVWDDARLAP